MRRVTGGGGMADDDLATSGFESLRRRGCWRSCRSDKGTGGAAGASMTPTVKQVSVLNQRRPVEHASFGARTREPAPDSKLTSVPAGQPLDGGRDRV
jgi:hypothetical protein